MEHHPRYIPDPQNPGKPRLVKDELEHSRVNPEDYKQFTRERAITDTASRLALADEDYQRGYNQGVLDQMGRDVAIAEQFPKTGSIGRNIGAAIRAAYTAPVVPAPVQPEGEPPLRLAPEAVLVPAPTQQGRFMPPLANPPLPEKDFQPGKDPDCEDQLNAEKKKAADADKRAADANK